MELQEVIDALVTETKKAIASEIANIKLELKKELLEQVIVLSKSTSSRTVELLIRETEQLILKSLDAKVNEKFATIEPPKEVTPEQIIEASKTVLATMNLKGEKGDSPTGEEVDALVKKHIAKLDLKGEKGDSPSKDEIDYAVKTYVATLNLKGDKGDQGDNGLDALKIDILPEIDPIRSYSKNTYASHDGGVWRAYKSTDPLGTKEPERQGWELVLRGISAIEVYQLGEKSVAVKTKMTGGKDFIHKVDLPMMSYKGVWQEGEFTEGDVVTWGGSAWYCKATTTTKPGEVIDGQSDWKLAVKKGRDGKDYNPNEPTKTSGNKVIKYG